VNLKPLEQTPCLHKLNLALLSHDPCLILAETFIKDLNVETSIGSIALKMCKTFNPRIAFVITFVSG
jgi:hypothetical protein